MTNKKTQEPQEATPAKSDVPTHFTTAVAKVDTSANFRAVKRLTRDVTSITRMGEAIIMCQSELYTIEMDSKFTPGEKRPVACIDCYDCLRGDEYVLVLGAVLTSVFRREEQPIRGNYYAIRSGEVGPGKRYRKDEAVRLERVE